MQKRKSLAIVRSVVFALVIREVRGRFSANRLGAFWFVFEPLAHIVVLMTIFSLMRGRTIQGMEFPVFLVTGIIPFLLFKNIALKGMEAVNANKALFAYRQIKPFDTILARAIVEFSLMAVIYLIVMSSLSIWGNMHTQTHYPLRWFYSMAVGVCLAFGLALIFAAIAQAFPEIKNFISILMMPLYFISGIVLPLWATPAPLLRWIMWNPFLHIIDNLRSSVFEYYPATLGVNLWYPTQVSVATLFVGLAIYRMRRLALVSL